MSTAPLTKLWTAYFDDGHAILQPVSDQYSKHDPDAEWNPSAFRDVLEYKGTLERFVLSDRILSGGHKYTVSLKEGCFYVNGTRFSLEETPLENRKLIYYREMIRDNINGEWQEAKINRYVIGYEGKDPEGKVKKKVIYING